jgi:hypothetical protein
VSTPQQALSQIQLDGQRKVICFPRKSSPKMQGREWGNMFLIKNRVAIYRERKKGLRERIVNDYRNKTFEHLDVIELFKVCAWCMNGV